MPPPRWQIIRFRSSYRFPIRFAYRRAMALWFSACQFVHHPRVRDKRLAGRLLFRRQFVGNDAAQVARVLTHGVVRVVAHLAVHLVDAARHRFCQAAASDDCVEAEGDGLLLQPVQHDVRAEVLLVHDLFERPQFLRLVSDGADVQRPFVLEHGHLCGGRARVDYQDAEARLLSVRG